MATRRRTSSGGSRGSKKRVALTLLLGVGIGIALLALYQFAEKRWHTRDGIATLFDTSGKPAKPESHREEPKKEEPRREKPRYDFYTILPETETVLPDRSHREKPEKAAKVEKSEESVSYILQAGSFAAFKDADELKAKLALGGLVAHIQKISIEGKGDYYRVRLGPYDKLDKLDAAEQQLRQLGVGKPMAIKVKKGTT
jgi:cell division protein FtsN